MYRCYFYLAAFVSMTAMSVSVFAETSAHQMPGDTQTHNWTPAANDAGFFVALPTADYDQLIRLIRTYQASLTHQEEEVARYLDENGFDTKDALITAIMPGGLLYAALRNANLEQARVELAEIKAEMVELSRDLLAMQAEAGELTVAQLQ